MAHTPKARTSSLSIPLSYSTPYPNRPHLLINDISPIDHRSERNKSNKIFNEPSQQIKRTLQLKRKIKESNLQSTVDKTNFTNSEQQSSMVNTYVASSDEEDEKVVKRAKNNNKPNSKKPNKSDVKKTKQQPPKGKSTRIRKQPNKKKKDLSTNSTLKNVSVINEEEERDQKNVTKISEKGKLKRNLNEEKCNSGRTARNTSGSNEPILTDKIQIKKNIEFGKDISNVDLRNSSKNNVEVLRDKSLNVMNVDVKEFKKSPVICIEVLNKASDNVKNEIKGTQDIDSDIKEVKNKNILSVCKKSEQGPVLTKRSNLAQNVSNSSKIYEEPTVILVSNADKLTSRCKRRVVKEKSNDKNNEENDVTLKTLVTAVGDNDEVMVNNNIVKYSEIESEEINEENKDCIKIAKVEINVNRDTNKLHPSTSFIKCSNTSISKRSNGSDGVQGSDKTEDIPLLNVKKNNREHSEKETSSKSATSNSTETEMPPASRKNVRSTRSKRATKAVSPVDTTEKTKESLNDNSSSECAPINTRTRSKRTVGCKQKDAVEEYTIEIGSKKLKTAKNNVSTVGKNDINSCVVEITKVKDITLVCSGLKKTTVNSKPDSEVKAEVKVNTEVTTSAATSKEEEQCDYNTNPRLSEKAEAGQSTGPVDRLSSNSESSKAQGSQKLDPNKESSTDTRDATRSKKKNIDNFVDVPCRCSRKKMQCFGPFNEGVYSSYKILGEGVEIMKCLKHENNLIAGHVKILKESCMSGKARNNTIYFVIEGNLQVNISGKSKNVKPEDCFMILQDAFYEIKNNSQEQAKLSFVKTAREL